MSGSFDASQAQTTLFDALVEARQTYGAKKPILEDQERNPLSYTDLIRACFALGRKIAAFTAPGERVAVMLPASSAAAVTFFALHAFGRVPTMLNFTSGIRNLRAACELAGVKRVLTSHRFVEQGKLHDLIDALETLTTVTYLEDVRATIGLPDKLYAATAGAFPKQFRTPTRPGDPGVILFTSGSFGAPRGVMLSQRNLLANVRQVAAHIDLDPSWVMFNPLPTFHCFGLTGGVLLPLLTGMKAFEYPSPLHIKQIPPLVKDTGASILLATDTFVNQYARSAEPDELSALKFIVCGAEKVREETHNLIAERFGAVPVLEGYGATEAAPVIAVNKPTDNRRGTVGGLLPGVETRLEPVDGIPGGGKLYVRGPNVRAGYLAPGGGIEPPVDGWHDTGDVVSIDEDNWVRIKGRVK
ncbi:MAG: AMP-binding protein, partial [Caulobacterales bacterium]